MQMTVVAWWVGKEKVMLVMVEHEVDKARSWQWVPRVWWGEKQVGTIIGPNLFLPLSREIQDQESLLGTFYRMDP